MRDRDKTKAQLIEELACLRQRIAELEAADASRMAPVLDARLDRDKQKKDPKRTEQALRQSEQNFRDLVENSPDGIIVADEKGVHLFVNRRAAEITGRSVDELRNTTIREMTHPDDLEKYEEMYEKRIRGGPVPNRYERLIVRKDGTTALTELTATTTIWQGKPASMVTIRDITDRKRAEEALRQSLKKTAHGQRLLLALSRAAQAMQRARTPDAVYRAIGEQAAGTGLDVTVLTLSEDRKHLIVSHLTLKPDLVRAAEKLTGLSAEGYRFSLTPGGFFQSLVAEGEAVLSHLDAASVAEALSRPAHPLAERLADLLDLKQSIVAPLSIGGEVQGLLAITGDNLTESDVPAVTAFANQAAIAIENTRLYKETQQLASFSGVIIQSIAEGIVVADADGDFTFVNPAAATLLGYAPDELVGLHWTAIIPPDQQPIVQAADERRMRGEADHYELELVRKDDQRVSVLVSGGPHFDAEGHFAGTMATFTDITDRKQTERALRKSEEMLDSILAASAIGIAHARDRQILWANDGMAKLFGFTEKGQYLGKDTKILYASEEEHRRAGKIVYEQQGSGGVVEFDAEFKRQDGSLFDGHVKVSALDPLNPMKGIIVSVMDITERKQAEAALRGSEHEKAVILDSLSELVSYQDSELRIIWANRVAAESVSLPVDELVGQHCYEIWPRQSEPCVGCPVAKAIETGTLQDAEMTTPDGRVWYIKGYPVQGENGDVIGVVEVTLEITDRKRAEEERAHLTAQVREQARQVEQILATVPEGVLLLDAEGRVLQANPVAEGDLAVLAGAKVGDVLTHLGNRPLAELLTSPPTKGLWHEIKGDNHTFEVIARPMEPALRPTADGRLPNGNSHEVEDWVLVINDVTQERGVQRRIQQQERLAAVGQLAAGIAHDFNNIMAVIVLYTQMGLSTPDIPSKLRERLQTVSQQAKRATNLIQQILDFSRRAVLERRPMELTSFLKEVVKLLERTVPESIKLSLSYGRDEYTVNADPTRMQQAIMNLAVNARNAMPEGGELRIALSKTAATDEIRCVTCDQVVEGEWVRIMVTDTGSGIPPDVLPYIFDPFFTTKAPGQGTGLGLAQVYGIVKQHEGHIDVTTKVGEGTTFIIYLPALLEHQPEAPPIETQTFVQGQKETILVVEDNATLRKALVDSVKLLNYHVLEAADGHEALDILERRAGEVSLVLSDLVMPEMGGQALFHAMRQRGLTLPVVMLSGHPMENELKSLQAEGLAGWMLKPPNLEQLSQTLAQVMREESE
jgi:two-component system cell cycle sensor histidine kinase/response regulator CckA